MYGNIIWWSYHLDLNWKKIKKKESRNIINTYICFCPLQAYTSQFVALIMFALLMCDDRISMQPRRREIIQGLRVLPGKSSHQCSGSVREILITHEIKMYRDGKPALRAEIMNIQSLFWFGSNDPLGRGSKVMRERGGGSQAIGCRPSHASFNLKHMMACPWC